MQNLIDYVQKLNNSQRVAVQLALLNTIPYLDVELSANCNANCIMCPRQKMQRQQQLMSTSIITMLTEWIPQPAKVMLAGLGEPLLNPVIFSFISALKHKKLTVGITTNGQLLTPANVNKLITSGIDLIQISFNGATKESYQKIMLGCSFKVVMENLNNLAKARPDNIDIKFAITKQPLNKHEITQIEQLAHSLKFGVFIRNCHSRAGVINTGTQMPVLPAACGIFAKVTFIASNGDILGCCQDLEGITKLGNIVDTSFIELTTIKKNIIANEQWFSICKYCDDEYRYYLLNNTEPED